MTLGAGVAWLLLQLVILVGPLVQPLPWWMWALVAFVALGVAKPFGLLIMLAVEYLGKWPTIIVIWGLALLLTLR